jgi:hypothetical protein
MTGPDPCDWCGGDLTDCDCAYSESAPNRVLVAIGWLRLPTALFVAASAGFQAAEAHWFVFTFLAVVAALSLTSLFVQPRCPAVTWLEARWQGRQLRRALGGRRDDKKWKVSR